MYSFYQRRQRQSWLNTSWRQCVVTSPTSWSMFWGMNTCCPTLRRRKTSPQRSVYGVEKKGGGLSMYFVKRYMYLGKITGMTCMAPCWSELYLETEKSWAYMRIEFWNTTFKTKDYILIFIHFHSKYLVHVYVFRHLDMKYIYIYILTFNFTWC